MLIKQPDDKSIDLQKLTELAERKGISLDVKQRIEQEVRNIRSGQRGEAEAAYEMEFHYGATKNWMILHDLRLECDGRVAQIDHLLINRFLEIYVCESKRFSEGIAINEHGEFAAFYGSRPYGVGSPIEQSKRHMAVLEAVFRTGQVAPPKRLGFTLKPSLHGLVLVSKSARISRPKRKFDGLDYVIKTDQLRARIDKDIDEDNNLLNTAKIIGKDTLEDFARRLAAAHKPASFDWAARFGLSEQALNVPLEEPKATAVAIAVVVPELKTAPEAAAPTEAKKSKLSCKRCTVPVPYNVARFCWTNKSKFGGCVYCIDCQKLVTDTTEPAH